jgi:hypothetical protein
MSETQKLRYKHRKRLRQLRHEYRVGLLTLAEYRIAVSIAKEIWRQVLAELEQ